MATSMNGFRKQNAYAPMQYYGTGQQNAPTEYTPAIPSYGSGISFPANLGKGQPTFDTNSFNYGGFEGLDGFDNTATLGGAAGTPGMWDSLGKFWGENKGTLMGNKDAPGLIPMGISGVTGIMNALNGFGANKMAKQSLQDARDRYAGDYAAQMATANLQIGDKAASSAGMGGMSRQDAEAYGRQYAATNGVQAYKGA